MLTINAQFASNNHTRVYNGSDNLRHPLMIGAILFGGQATFSMAANILVVLLFTCRKQLLSKPHNRCILSLAIADILTSISVLTSPNFVLGEKFYNPKGHSYLTRELYCRFLWSSWLPFALGVTSLYTSAVLSFERWLLVRRQFFYRSRFKLQHMNFLILASWITAFITEVPVAIFVEGVYDETTEICRYTLAQDSVLTICLSTGKFLFQTVMPLAFITLAYFDVFRGIKISLRFITSARAEHFNGVKRLKKVTKLAAITTLVLVICWIPSTVWYFISLLLKDPSDDPHDPLLIFVRLLVFGNCCINPCIYVYSNLELRNTLRDILSLISFM